MLQTGFANDVNNAGVRCNFTTGAGRRADFEKRSKNQTDQSRTNGTRGKRNVVENLHVFPFLLRRLQVLAGPEKTGPKKKNTILRPTRENYIDELTGLAVLDSCLPSSWAEKLQPPCSGWGTSPRTTKVVA